MVMPGDNVSVDVELIVPIAMEEGLRFAIREGAVPSAPASSHPSSNNRQPGLPAKLKVTRAGPQSYWEQQQ